MQVRLLPPVPTLLNPGIMRISDIDTFVVRETPHDGKEKPYEVRDEEDICIYLTKAQLTSIYSTYKKRCDTYRLGLKTVKPSNRVRLQKKLEKAQNLMKRIAEGLAGCGLPSQEDIENGE